MTLLMAYCLLLSAAVAAMATIGDHVLRSRPFATRGLWFFATLLVVPLTGVVMLMPRAAETSVAHGGVTALPVIQSSDAPVAMAPSAHAWLALSDVALTVTWIGASLLLFAALFIGRWRVTREKNRARAGKVQGHDVLLTDDLGPAVAGVRQPVVFVPRWVIALDDASQRLLLAHEVEHLRRRDTGMLMAGAAITALLPWNPVAWWLARRLRIAVELDCDSRVLAAHPDVRRYADLLLLAAAKPKFTSRLLAAHFGEHISDLERRIDAMTNRKWRLRSLLLAAVAAVGLTMASCEAPRPEPLAPRKDNAEASPSAVASGTDYFEFQVEKPASRTADSPAPRYPEILRQAGVEGEVLVSFVVDETGVADPETFTVIKSTHELFATAVRKALPDMRFIPAEVGGKKVRQVVQAPFSFAIAGTKVQSGGVLSSENTTYVTGANGQKQLAFTVRKSDAPATPPHVVVHSFEGQELAKGTGDQVLNTIDPQTIQSIEVFKGNACQPYECPLIKIRLAKGKTLGSATSIRPNPEQPSEDAAQGAEAKKLAFRVNRFDILSSKMNVELLASSGEVLARYDHRPAPGWINTEDIAASETYNGTGCKAISPCPLTRVWLKAGREGAYRKK